MAVTSNTFTGNGSTTNYSFTFEYIKQADVKVTLDSAATTAFTFANATTLSFTTAPASGVAIRIFRDTDIATLNATFFPGSAIKAEDLNNNFTQNHFATQETDNEVVTANTTANTAKTTAEGAVTTANNAVTTSNNAVTTANSAVTTANTASTNASAAVTTANTASTNASAAVTTANTASTNASNAVTTANSAATDAATAISTANSATTTANAATTAANAAQADANTATATANAATTTANSATTTANAASTTANTASTNASAAVTTANSASATANAASQAVSAAAFFQPIGALANLPSSPSNEDRVEVVNSTGVESNSAVSGVPSGFVGSTDLTVRLQYNSSTSKWVWSQYFASDPENRYATNYLPVIKGDGSSSGQVGKITLNCSNNNHGVSIQSPPHSANATYALTLPTALPSSTGQALTSDTNGNLSYFDPVNNTGVTAGNYSAADLTINAQGRITAASNGQIATSEIASNAITSGKLATGAVTTAKIADNAVTGDKLADDIVIAGNLTVNGTTTTVNSTTLTVDDKNIELGSVSTPSDTTADGGGITIKGATDKTLTWENSTSSWTFNQPVVVSPGGTERLRVGPAGQVGIAGANYGTTGQVLTSGGASASPTWGDVSGSPSFEATASGTLANGQTVIIQSDGTVTGIVRDQASESIGNSIAATSGASSKIPTAALYVEDGGKVVVFYKNTDNDNLYAVAGTVSGTSISFGTAVEVTSDNVEMDTGNFDVAYDTNANRIMCVYKNKTVSDRGMARVLSLSGTTLTVGSEITFNTVRTTWPCVVFDSSQNKVVVFFSDGSQDRHSYVVGTISTSGNTATFQSVQLISGNYTASYSKAIFSGNNQILLAYYNNDAGRGYARICTLSGNTLTLGSQETITATQISNIRVAYHSSNNEFYVAYTRNSNDFGRVIAASFTGTGTGLQFGSPTSFESNNAYKFDIAYHPKTNKIHLIWRTSGGTLKYTTVTSNNAVSPTIIVAGESDMTPANGTNHPYLVYDASASKLVFFYQNTSQNPAGTYATVYQPAYDSSNLSDNNFIGISDAAYTNGQTATIQVVGSVDDAQSGLTPGVQYFVQKNGSLALTADSPSVSAGVAVGATKLLIK